MAGRMGHERVTVKNLAVVAVLDDAIWIKGLVPGGKNNLVYIKKIGEIEKFVPLIDEPKVKVEEVAAVAPVEEPNVEEVEEKKEGTEHAK